MTTTPTVAEAPEPAATKAFVNPARALVGRSFQAMRNVGWVAEWRSEWNAFASRYLTPEGRIVDTGNGRISHSEGQGVALLFAAEALDRYNFDRILAWTRSNLRRRHDALHAWRFSPTASIPVTDRNNATDGDIMIAWGLLRGADRFSEASFALEARDIAQSILKNCTATLGQRLVLLPGMHGFEARDHVVVNPSYYAFAALADFEQIAPGPEWRQLIHDGLQICCRNAKFGRWNLPADWIEVPRDTGRPIRLSADRPPRFSWDAVRVPLNLVWAQRWGDPMLYDAAAFWMTSGDVGRPPAWAGLRDDAVAPYPGHAGIQAVARVTKAAADGRKELGRLPRVADATDYYGASLTLLARLAWQEAVASA